VTDEFGIEGEFWHPGHDITSSGTLSVHDDEKSALTVMRFIVPQQSVTVKSSPSGGLQITHSGDPDKIVADYKPYTILGRSKDGRDITLLEAHGGNEWTANHGLGQVFESQSIVIGRHVASDTTYSHARYAIDRQWIGTHYIGEAVFDALGGGILRTYRDGDLIWIEFEASKRATLREYENHMMLPCMTLEGIARRRPLPIARTQVRIEEEGDWLNVHTNRSSRPTPKGSLGSGIIDLRELTLERLASWVDLSFEAEGLVDAIAGFDETAPLEAQVVTMTAVSEGIHRKLSIYKESVQFPELSKAQRRSVRRAAREAAMQALIAYGITDQDRIKKALESALNSFNDVTYRTRLEELQATALEVHPAMLDSFEDWPKSVTFVRNKIVHQLDDENDQITPSEDSKSREHLFDLMIAAVYSLNWVLRTVFLVGSGFSREKILSGLLENSPYLYAQANISSLLTNHPHGKKPRPS
jgi:hypothetical protein